MGGTSPLTSRGIKPGRELSQIRQSTLLLPTGVTTWSVSSDSDGAGEPYWPHLLSTAGRRNAVLAENRATRSKKTPASMADLRPGRSSPGGPTVADMKQPIIQSAGQAEKPLNVGGFQITVLASTDQTGDYELFRISGPAGTGPGPHHHAWDESFFVLSGGVHCGVGEKESLATEGGLIHVPGGTTHWFRFVKDGGELLAVTSRGNASEMFQAFDKGINWADPDRRALVALAASYGQTVVPK